MAAYTLLGLLFALLVTLPLAWKWQLPLGRVAIAITLFATSSGLVLALTAGTALDGLLLRTGLVSALTLIAAVAVLAWRFFRDPERDAPKGDHLVVSPADGTVLYVRQAVGGHLPVSTKQGRDYALHELTRTPLRSEDAVVIGIGMNFLDVHVNRAPIAGTVTLQRHFAGRFGSLREPEMVFQNERATTVIERDGIQVAVVQIASRLVRQIVAYVREGQDVTLGQRIGAIRFGSQVDLVIPAPEDLQITVTTGESVIAGRTVLAVFGRRGAESPGDSSHPAQTTALTQ